MGTDPIDAVVLAGGRSTRLSQPDGAATDKAGLEFDGRSLLDRSVSAASVARRIVVVGDASALDSAHPNADRVVVTREDPPFGGPAAGLAVGLTMLTDAAGATPSAFTLVLACDMPDAARAVRSLLEVLEPGSDGVIAVDALQQRQPLAAVYSTSRLAAAIRARVETGGIDGMSMRSLISGLRLAEVLVPAGATDDVDTWADAARLGVRLRPAQTRTAS